MLSRLDSVTLWHHTMSTCQTRRASLAHRNRFSPASLLLAGLARVCLSWPIRADWMQIQTATGSLQQVARLSCKKFKTIGVFSSLAAYSSGFLFSVLKKTNKEREKRSQTKIYVRKCFDLISHLFKFLQSLPPEECVNQDPQRYSIALWVCVCVCKCVCACVRVRA